MLATLLVDSQKQIMHRAAVGIEVLAARCEKRQGDDGLFER